jgi:acyl-CoA hydrolase
MAWMENCATIAAMRHSKHICIAVAVDTMHFLNPVQVGEAVIIKAKVTRAFRTSMEVSVKVKSENLITGKRQKCNDAFFTFIAIEDGIPTPVLQLLPETEKEIKKYHEALARRKWRIERKILFENIEMIPLPNEDNIQKIFQKLEKNSKDENNKTWEEMYNKDGIKVWFKDVPLLTISEERMCCMKGILIIQAFPEDIFDLIVNLEKRLEWDDMYCKGTLIESPKDNAHILHMLGKPLKKKC